MSAIIMDDRSLLNAVGRMMYDGVGANELAAYLGDVLGDYDDEVGDELDDALGAAPRARFGKRPGQRAVAMAREAIKTFRIEPAAAELITFPVAGPFVQPVKLAVIRDFKVVDMIFSATNADGDTLKADQFTLSKVTIKGTQQSSSNEDQNMAAFGTGGNGVASIRPKIDWDTVNSTVPLTANLNYVGPTPLDATTHAYITFVGVAARGAVS